ncbi:MAG: 50S ribosomal protein L23 [Candidatus Dasytiphilus stammeri]
MMNDEKMIYHKILHFPHVSEKSSNIEKTNNIVIFEVAKDATKAAIKIAIEKIFNIEVTMVNTLQVKGKEKHHFSKSKRIKSRRRNWKKAYIYLKSGQKIDLLNNSIE